MHFALNLFEFVAVITVTQFSNHLHYFLCWRRVLEINYALQSWNYLFHLHLVATIIIIIIDINVL